MDTETTTSPTTSPTTGSTTSTETVDAYLAAYGEPDPARRRQLIEAAFAHDAVLADPPFVATGHDELHATFAAVQEQFPGHRFRRCSDSTSTTTPLATDIGPEGHSSTYLTVRRGRTILKYMLDRDGLDRTSADVDLDAVFRALANEGRRTMLDRLCGGPASLSELAEPLDMTLSAVEQHVRTLERCGLVRTEKRGRTRYCRLEPATMDLAERWIADRRNLWERRLDRLGEVLGSPPTRKEP